MIVSMNNVVKRYQSHIALERFTLDISAGEVLGLLGPNGAGKTTAIRVLTGLTSADGGEITLFGSSAKDAPSDIKKRVGVVPQDLALYETLPAQDNLEFFGKLYGIKGAELKKRVGETLEILGLTDVSKKSPKKFSGGMKRRLNIGCAIIHNPELLILDEPTVGIDPQSRNHILDFVTEINRRGTTVLYTSHYMEEVERICSRVCVMDEGRVIADGSAEELCRSVITEETVTLEVKEPTNGLADAVKKIRGVKDCDIIGGKLTVTVEVGAENLAGIIDAAAPYTIISVSAQRPTLQDAFLSLTGKKLRDGGFDT